MTETIRIAGDGISWQASASWPNNRARELELQVCRENGDSVQTLAGLPVPDQTPIFAAMRSLLTEAGHTSVVVGACSPGIVAVRAGSEVATMGSGLVYVEQLRLKLFAFSPSTAALADAPEVVGLGPGGDIVASYPLFVHHDAPLTDNKWDLVATSDDEHLYWQLYGRQGANGLELKLDSHRGFVATAGETDGVKGELVLAAPISATSLCIVFSLPRNTTRISLSNAEETIKGAVYQYALLPVAIGVVVWPVYERPTRAHFDGASQQHGVIVLEGAFDPLWPPSS